MWFKSGMEATKRSGLKPIAKIVIPKRFAKAFWKYFSMHILLNFNLF
jgi:hypothetical protein